MDWASLLQVQQRDFVNRLTLGNLLISKQKNILGEITFLNQELIKKITEESAKEAQAVAEKYNLHSPVEEILNTVFCRKSIEQVFLSQWDDLIWVDNVDHQKFDDDYNNSKLVRNSFVLKKANHVKILVKTYISNEDNLLLELSPTEIEEYQIFAFCLAPENYQKADTDSAIKYLGFTTKDLAKNSKLSRFKIEDLLYIGGLRFCAEFSTSHQQSGLQEIKHQFNKGNYQKAITMLDYQITKGSNNDPNLYFMKGVCRYRLGDKQRALRDFRQVMEFDTNNHFIHHWLGNINLELGNYQQALSHFDSEIKINPLSFFAYFQKGFIYRKLNRFVEALEEYNTAIKINNDFFQVFYNRGEVFYHLGDKGSAIEDYQQAVKLRPNLTQAYYCLGVIYHQLSKYKQAMDSYELAINFNSEYINALYNLAILQANLGLYKKAIDTHEQILQINPNFMPSIYNQKSIAMLLKKEGHIITTSNDHLPLPPEIIPIKKESGEKENEDDSKNANQLENKAYDMPSKETQYSEFGMLSID